eukprot:m.27604 g.27604  ORF g.27604 m.27604 type:complete len:320 (+) comp30203_c0_seq1:66-1025(+)
MLLALYGTLNSNARHLIHSNLVKEGVTNGRLFNASVATSVTMVELNVDSVIEKLLAVRATPGKQVNLPEPVVRQLCQVSRQIFLDQPMLLEIAAPVNIVGDLHGQYEDFLRQLDKVGYPPDENYLFLGDYVDRGKRSLETICLAMAYKIKYPENFFLLRGNHECASINRVYGFYDEIKRRYNIKLWKTFTDCFNCMPIVAIVEDTIFCMHGGLSPDLVDLDQIRELERPMDIPGTGLVCDLLWSDPDEDITGWGENDRGVSCCFGRDVVKEFLERHNFSLIVRAHQVLTEKNIICRFLLLHKLRRLLKMDISSSRRENL